MTKKVIQKFYPAVFKSGPMTHSFQARLMPMLWPYFRAGPLETLTYYVMFL